MSHMRLAPGVRVESNINVQEFEKEEEKETDPDERESGKKQKSTLSADWEKILGKVEEDQKYIIGRVPSMMFERDTTHFCTGSTYTGQWDKIGMSGFGTYILPHGVEYEGQMHDGMFHGEGTLTFPMGQKIDGVWDKGRMVSWKYRFPDGLEYSEPWSYCQMPDRRFATSIREGLRPAGRELVTNDYLARDIPGLCYDVGDGFYNPKTKCVTTATPSKLTLRIPTNNEEMWIMMNCRKAQKTTVGYKPELYEYWISGRKYDDVMFELLEEYEEKEIEEPDELEVDNEQTIEDSEKSSAESAMDEEPKQRERRKTVTW